MDKTNDTAELCNSIDNIRIYKDDIEELCDAFDGMVSYDVSENFKELKTVYEQTVNIINNISSYDEYEILEYIKRINERYRRYISFIGMKMDNNLKDNFTFIVLLEAYNEERIPLFKLKMSEEIDRFILGLL